MSVLKWRNFYDHKALLGKILKRILLLGEKNGNNPKGMGKINHSTKIDALMRNKNNTDIINYPMRKGQVMQNIPKETEEKL